MNIQDNFEENGIIPEAVSREDVIEMLLTKSNREIATDIAFLEHLVMLDNAFTQCLMDVWDISEKTYNETEIRLLILDRKIKSKFNKMIYYYTNSNIYFESYESMNDLLDDEDEIGGLTTVLLATKKMLIKEIKIYHVYMFELLTKLSFIKHQMIKIELLLKRQHTNSFDRVFVILMEQFKMDYLDTYKILYKFEKKFKKFKYNLNDKFNNPDVYNVLQMHYI